LVDTVTRDDYTHCNARQFTATHYSALQHTAAYCSTLQHLQRTVSKQNAYIPSPLLVLLELQNQPRTAYLTLGLSVPLNLARIVYVTLGLAKMVQISRLVSCLPVMYTGTLLTDSCFLKRPMLAFNPSSRPHVHIFTVLASNHFSFTKLTSKLGQIKDFQKTSSQN